MLKKNLKGIVFVINAMFMFFLSLLTIHFNNQSYFLYIKSLDYYKITYIKVSAHGCVSVLLQIIKYNKIIQEYLTSNFCHKTNLNLKSSIFTFWKVLSNKSVFTLLFFKEQKKIMKIRIFWADEESMFPICGKKSSDFIERFYTQFNSIKRNHKFPYTRLRETLCENKSVPPIFSIDTGDLSVYNTRGRINLISCSSKIILALTRTCFSELKNHFNVSIDDIKNLRKFSLISGNAIVDVFSRVLVKEHFYFKNKKKINVLVKCISQNVTIISKVFRIKIKFKIKNVKSCMLLVVRECQSKIKILYFLFTII